MEFSLELNYSDEIKYEILTYLDIPNLIYVFFLNFCDKNNILGLIEIKSKSKTLITKMFNNNLHFDIFQINDREMIREYLKKQLIWKIIEKVFILLKFRTINYDFGYSYEYGFQEVTKSIMFICY